MTRYIQASEAPMINDGVIKLYTEKDFEGLQRAGQLTATILDRLADLIVPGITTTDIDRAVYDFGLENNVVPATLYYRGYTKSCCTSINHVVCHGIPNDKPLKDGDIINVDVTYVLDGWHGDSSRMYIVGTAKRAAERLIEVTYEAMMRGVEAAIPGNTTGHIGAAIQEVAEKERCSIVRDFCGHGIGRLFHDAPNVLHYGQPGAGVELRPGMVFTIEPMINLGRAHMKVLSDRWTAVTRDRSLSAQFEHMVGITDDGYQIFTQSPGGRHKPPYA